MFWVTQFFLRKDFCMAVHHVCPRDEGIPEDEQIVIGTALYAARCRNLSQHKCKSSDGLTAGSLVAIL